MGMIAVVALTALSASCFADELNSKGQLNIDSITVGTTTYSNVLINLGTNWSVVSVGGSTQAASSSSQITLAQLNACPNTSQGTSAQFWSCFTGTITGVEEGQTFPCTLTIGNGQITLATTDNNISLTDTPTSITYSKTANDFPYTYTLGRISTTISSTGIKNSIRVNSQKSPSYLSCTFTLN